MQGLIEKKDFRELLGSAFIFKHAPGLLRGILWKWILRGFRTPSWESGGVSFRFTGWISHFLLCQESEAIPKECGTVIYPTGNPLRRFLSSWRERMKWTPHKAQSCAFISKGWFMISSRCGLTVRGHGPRASAQQGPMPPTPLKATLQLLMGLIKVNSTHLLGRPCVPWPVWVWEMWRLKR